MGSTGPNLKVATTRRPMEVIAPPANPNMQGAKLGDPSVALMMIIGRLQRTIVKDEIIVLPEAIAAEALANVKANGWALVVHPDDPTAFMFCRHWVCPPPHPANQPLLPQPAA